MPNHPLLNIAVRAARKAGDVIARGIDRFDTFAVSEKAPNDFVTDVDRIAEQRIIDTIRKSYPDHAILAEESGAHGRNDFEWIIDPLDGTANFMHGFPHVAVSIAVRHRGRIEHAVVFDPLRQELFTASRGSGGRIGDRRLRVAVKSGLKGALLGSGLPFREFERFDLHHAALKALMSKSAQIRRSGSAALDLAYVAAGRLDGFWESGLAPWDIAAGTLLVQEAGGIVADPDGGDDYLRSGAVAAANPKVLRAMLPHLRHGPAAPAGPRKARKTEPRATTGPETAPPEERQHPSTPRRGSPPASAGPRKARKTEPRATTGPETAPPEKRQRSSTPRRDSPPAPAGSRKARKTERRTTARPEPLPPEKHRRPSKPRRDVPARTTTPGGGRPPGPDAKLPITLVPSPAEIFRKALMRTKQAWILVKYRDGREEVRRWTAPRISATSNIIGNLRSRPEFQGGAWRQNGIASVRVSIRRP